MPEAITNNIALWSSALLTRSTAGRGSNGKLEAYGIKKLRELILELAVRGKLLPQDPNDEPASELLKHIQAEKAKLIAEGKIRKGKPLPSIIEDEKLFKLPHGWEWVRLGTLGEWGAGATPARGNSKYYGGDIPWFKSGELTADYISQSEETVTELALKECSLRANSVGDVLIAMYGATIGKTAILSVPATTNQAVCACTPFNGIANRYLLLLLKALKPNFIGQGAGGAQPNISREKIIATITALPPLDEQHRIVAKVDELMALCDQLEQQQTHSIAAHQTLVASLLGTLTRVESQQEFSEAWARIASHFDTLFTTEASIDQLKQTILQLAVMGKLVPQDSDDEPANALLKRIQTEKAKLIAEGKIKKGKPLEPITEDEKLFELPKLWEWVRFGDLATQITDGAHHTPEYISDGVPFLSVKNLSSGYLDFTDTRFISPAAHVDLTKRCNPELDDILLTKIGTTGIAVVIDDPRPFSIFVSVALIKLPKVLIDRDYLSLVINSPFVRQQSEDGTEGVGNKKLVLRKISTFDIPLAPLAEQHRIVAKVDELMALCDTLKARLADAQAIQLHLADAIVEQAVC